MSLDINSVQAVLMHAARCREVADQLARAGVTGKDFIGRPCRFLGPLWDAILYFYKEQRSMPSRFVIEQIVYAASRSNPMEADDAAKYSAFMSVAFDTPDNQLRPEFIMAPGGWLQALIDDLKFAPALERAAFEADSARRADGFHAAREIFEVTRVSTVKSVDVLDPEVAAVMTTNSEIEPCGLDYVDKMVGGVKKTMFMGLLAGSGGGKTLAGLQYGLEQAMRGYHTLYLTYEQEVNGDISERIYAYLAGVDRNKVARPYADFEPEIKSRMAASRKITTAYWRLVSMAGDTKNQGKGGVPEIVTTIQHYRDREKFPVRNVIIDWFRPMVLKWKDLSRQTRAKDLREQMVNALSQLAQIRDEYRVRILLLHQIAPHEYKSLTPSAKPDWTVAEDCKSFAEDMDACMVFGKVDPFCGVMHASMAKCRWRKNTDGEAPVAGAISRRVKLDGARCRIDDVHGLWRVNEDARYSGGQEAYFVKDE